MTRFTPNQTRILYDVLVCAIGAFFVFCFDRLIVGTSAPLALFLTPLFLLVFNFFLGVFSRLRMASSPVKAIALTVSVFASATLLYLLSHNLEACILWSALVWAPIVLPRVFLHMNTRSRSGLIKSAIRNRGPVLVVGGGGYIGSYVVEQLLQAGYPVRLLDRFIYGKQPISDLLSDRRLEVIEGDVTEIMKLTQAMAGASAVVHLAGLVGDPACAVDEAFTRHANVITTRMLKEVALSLAIPRFIFASSCSVYGASDEEVDETSKLNPVSLYAHTKVDSEKELLSCIDESFCLTILRFATVFGHSRRPRFDLVANLFVAQAFIDGRITLSGENQWRPFVHVRDLARAVLGVVRAPEKVVQGQIFNVGDSRLNMTIGQLAQTVRNVVAREREVEIVPAEVQGDRRNYMVSFKKIKRALGFEASVAIEDGIHEILGEFKKGSYSYYRNASYSNVEMTKVALKEFRDPLQSSRLYHPLSEEQTPPQEQQVAQAINA